MKNFLSLALFLTLSLFNTPARAAILGAPFLPEIDARFNCIETGYCQAVGSGPGLVATGYVAGSIPFNALQQGYGATGQFGQGTYKADVVINGDTAGTYNTTIVLPAKTIIRQAYIFVKSAVTPAGTTTAFQCVGANDILTATDETGVSANGIIAGAETGLGGAMLYSSAGCTVKLVTAVHTATAGEFFLFLDTSSAQ